MTEADMVLPQASDTSLTLLDALPFGVQVVDTNGQVLYSNTEMRALLGETDLGSKCRQVYSDSKEPGAYIPMNSAGDAGAKAVIRVEGSLGRRTFQVTHSPVHVAGQDLALELFQDITKQEHATQTLQESEQRFRQLVDLLPETIFEADRTGRVTFGNQVAYERFGYTPEQFEKGINLLSNCAPEELNRMKENIGRVLSGEPTEPREYTLLRADGSRFPAVVSTSRIMRDGQPVGIRGFVIDMSERKKAKSALIESEARFKRLAENSDDVIYRYELNPTRFFSYVSPAVTAVTGYTPDEFYRDPLLGMKIVHPDDRELAEAALAGEEVTHATAVRAIHKDGRIVRIEQHNVPIHDASGELVAIEGIARDISERHQALAQRLRQEMTLAIPRRATARGTGDRRITHGRVQTRLLVAWQQLGECEDMLSADRGRASSLLVEARKLIDEIREKEIRQASHRLHPSIINMGLVAAVRSLVESFETHFTVNIVVDNRIPAMDSALENRIPEPVRLAAYRMLAQLPQYEVGTTFL